MRQYGETPLNRMGKAKKLTRHFKAAIHTDKIEVPCRTCGVIMMLSPAKIREYGKDKSCYTCRKAGKKEVEQAMINLARRKGLIK